MRLTNFGLILALITGEEDEVWWWMSELQKRLEGAGTFAGSSGSSSGGSGQEASLSVLSELEEDMNRRQALAVCDGLLLLLLTTPTPMEVTKVTARISLAHRLLVRYHHCLTSSVFCGNVGGGTSSSRQSSLPNTVRTAWIDRLVTALSPPTTPPLPSNNNPDARQLLLAGLKLLADLVPGVGVSGVIQGNSGCTSSGGGGSTHVSMLGLEPHQQVIVMARHRGGSPRPAVIQELQRYDGTLSVVYQDDGIFENRLTPDRILEAAATGSDEAWRLFTSTTATGSSHNRPPPSSSSSSSQRNPPASLSDPATPLLQRFLALANAHDIITSSNQDQPLRSTALKVMVKLVALPGIDSSVVLREVLLAPWLLNKEDVGPAGLKLVRKVLSSLKDLPHEEEKGLKARLAEVVLKAFRQIGGGGGSSSSSSSAGSATKAAGSGSSSDQGEGKEEAPNKEEERWGAGGEEELADALWILDRCMAETGLSVSPSFIKASSGQGSAHHAFSSSPFTCWQSAGTPPHWIQARLPSGWGRVDFKCEAFDRGFAIKELVVLVGRSDTDGSFKEVRKMKFDRRQLQNQEWVTLLRLSDITDEMMQQVDDLNHLEVLDDDDDDDEMDALSSRLRRRVANDRRGFRLSRRRQAPASRASEDGGGGGSSSSSNNNNTTTASARRSSADTGPMYLRVRVTQCDNGLNCKVRQIRVLPFMGGEEKDDVREEEVVVLVVGYYHSLRWWRKHWWVLLNGWDHYPHQVPHLPIPRHRRWQ